LSFFIAARSPNDDPLHGYAGGSFELIFLFKEVAKAAADVLSAPCRESRD